MKQKRGKPAGAGLGRLVRSEVLQIRTDKRLSYAISIAAQSQKRSVSSFVESAISEHLNTIQINNFLKDKTQNITFFELLAQVWDFDSTVRFTKLAQIAPSLLSTNEAIIWEIINKEACFWNTVDDLKVIDVELVRELMPHLERLLENGDIAQYKLAQKEAVLNSCDFADAEQRDEFVALYGKVHRRTL
jgi:uncharacterized protein (DUF1778 family)